MLYNLTDGELRVYKSDNTFIEILFYNNDFSAPLYGSGELSFSCSISDNKYTEKLISFFNYSGLFIVEYIWSSSSNKFGKKYTVRIDRDNLMLLEGKNNLNKSKNLSFYFKGTVVVNKFITKFSEGKDITKLDNI